MLNLFQFPVVIRLKVFSKKLCFCAFYLFYYLCRPMHFEELYLSGFTNNSGRHTDEKHFPVIY